MDPIIEEIRSAFEQFKKANDQRLAEIEKHGQANAETTAKVDRINAAIDGLQATLTQRMDDLEARLNRSHAGGFGGARPTDQQLRLYALWQSAAQQKPVEPEQVDLKLIDKYNRAFADWMRRGERAAGDHLQLLNEMSVQSVPDGGVLVGPDMSGRIIMMQMETSPMRSLASVQTISTDVFEGMNDLGEAGTGGWVGETAARTGPTDTPQLGTWRIPVHEQWAEPRATQKLLDDAQIDVEGWLARKVAAKFSRDENTAFVTGSGVLKPRGFTTYAEGTPSAATWDVVERVHSGAAATLTADGLIDLVAALKDAYTANARFAMRRATQFVIRKLKDGLGNYLWQPDFASTGRATILGFPVVDFADMPAIGAGNLAVAFGDFRQAYQIVDRMGIRVLRDPYTTKGYVKFYTTKRVGGAVINFEALKLLEVAA